MNADHNGHTPSIAIGTIDFYRHLNTIPISHEWVESPGWICIAYTSQFDNHTGYHVIAGGWRLNGGYANRYFIPIRHPVNDFLDAGLPCISITPNDGTTRNFAAVVLTQQVGADGYGPQMRVFEFDLFGINDILNPGEWFEVPTPVDHADCLYPSIALHRNTTDEGPFFASITYMAQDPEADTLQPATMLLEIELDTDLVDPPHFQANRSVEWQSEVIENSDDIFGNYNISQIPFIDPGITTAIVTGDGSYWAAWSERIEMEPPPQNVIGTFGWIGD